MAAFRRPGCLPGTSARRSCCVSTRTSSTCTPARNTPGGCAAATGCTRWRSCGWSTRWAGRWTKTPAGPSPCYRPRRGPRCWPPTACPASPPPWTPPPGRTPSDRSPSSPTSYRTCGTGPPDYGCSSAESNRYARPPPSRCPAPDNSSWTYRPAPPAGATKPSPPTPGRRCPAALPTLRGQRRLAPRPGHRLRPDRLDAPTRLRQCPGPYRTGHPAVPHLPHSGHPHPGWPQAPAELPARLALDWSHPGGLPAPVRATRPDLKPAPPAGPTAPPPPGERRPPRRHSALQAHPDPRIPPRDGQLAWLAADRAASAAQLADAAALSAVAAYQAACALLLLPAKLADAEAIAVTAAEDIGTNIAARDTDLLSARGSLLLLAALITARRNDGRAARQYLTQAASAAQQLGRDGNHLWTAFGPTNVLLHRISVAVALGRPDEATSMGETVDTARLPSTLIGRRTQIHLDLAAACAQRPDGDSLAVLHLLEAERVAPQAVRVNAAARSLLASLLARERRAVTPGLRPLATRAGVAA